MILALCLSYFFTLYTLSTHSFGMCAHSPLLPVLERKSCMSLIFSFLQLKAFSDGCNEKLAHAFFRSFYRLIVFHLVLRQKSTSLVLQSSRSWSNKTKLHIAYIFIRFAVFILCQEQCVQCDVCRCL